MTRGRAAALLLVVLAAGVYAFWPGSDERAIRRALVSLADEFNQPAGEGLATMARAAQLGSYFSEDVVVDLGSGAGQIQGRDRLTAMAAQLQPRTTAFRVALDDVDVEMSGADGGADVTLTVRFIRRDSTADEPSTDAREFVLRMAKTGGRWRIARATAVDTFRK